MNKRRHRKELNSILSTLIDQGGNAAIMEIFDDLQKNRDLYRDQLTALRGKYKKQQDELNGIVRDLDYSITYIMIRANMLKSFALYFDTASDRFCAISEREPAVTSYELVGVYTAPYNKYAIREDMRCAFDEHLARQDAA